MTTREKAQQIALSLDDQTYSTEFVEAEIATTVPFQIRAMRKERGWTQKDLASKTGQHQTTISDFENPDIGPGSIVSLLKIAAAFDVGLIVRFAPFSELVDWSVNMTSANHFVPSRTKDARLRAQRSGARGTSHASAYTQLRFWSQATSRGRNNVTDFREWKAAAASHRFATTSNTLGSELPEKRAHAY